MEQNKISIPIGCKRFCSLFLAPVEFSHDRTKNIRFLFPVLHYNSVSKEQKNIEIKINQQNYVSGVSFCLVVSAE